MIAGAALDGLDSAEAAHTTRRVIMLSWGVGDRWLSSILSWEKVRRHGVKAGKEAISGKPADEMRD